MVGEEFFLHADCVSATPPCVLDDNPPGVSEWSTPFHRSVDYVPALITANNGSNVCPSCEGTPDYERSIECPTRQPPIKFSRAEAVRLMRNGITRPALAG